MRTRENKLQFISAFLDLVLLSLLFAVIVVVAAQFPQQYFLERPDVLSCFLIANLSCVLVRVHHVIKPGFIAHS
jgi:hypothetical protein